MNYSVKDSSIRYDPVSYKSHLEKDDSIRVGMVREVKTVSDGSIRYLVEVHVGGNQVPVSCQMMTRFGGVYNFEDYRVRPWARTAPSGALLPTTASTYDLRSGDMVVVGFINGKSKEGVILGGLKHEARSSELAADIEYQSRFNGFETKVGTDGSYKMTFNGAALNEAALEVPGVPIMDPIYNPLAAGSFLEFQGDGGIAVDNGNGVGLFITKSAIGGSLTITSGGSTIVLGGNLAIAEINVATDNMTVEASMNTVIKSELSIKVETLQLSLKGTQVAIGNDSIELIDGLIQLIDAIGQLTIMSPVGTCTPVMAAPQWAGSVIPLKVKLSTLKGSL